MAGLKKQETDTSSVEVGVKRKPGKQRGHLQTMAHGLYFDVTKFQIDGRSSLGKQIHRVLVALLEPFSKPIPAPAEMLARRTAYKLLRAASFEAYILGGGTPAPSTDQDYLRLTGSIRADLQLLHVMAKGNGGGDAPDLKEYLEALRKASKATPIHKVEAEGASPDE
jgi:hypothetical protein